MSNPRSRLLALVLASVLAVSSLPLLAPAAGAVAPVDSPTNLAPTDGDNVAANPQLGWTPPADAARSRVQISISPTFASLLVNEVTYNRTYTPTVELPTGTVYWRVAGVDTGSGQGPFAESSFVKGLPAPNPLAPAPGEKLDYPGTPPSFAWDPTPSARSYVLEVDDADDFIGASRYVTVNTGYTPLNPLAAGPDPGKPYFWRVRGSSATNGTGVLTDWSSTRSFGVTWSATANLIAPTGTVTDTEFEWDPVPGATAYNLQVDFDDAFTTPLALTGTNIHANRLTYRDALDNASYHWRVQAIDAKGNLGSWSPSKQFTRQWLAAPTLTSPAAGTTTTGNLRFQWSPVDHASKYQIQIGTDQFFSPNTFTQCTTVQTAIVEGFDCREFNTGSSGTYYWRVRGVDDPSGIIGVWSATRAQSGHTAAVKAAGTFNPLTEVNPTGPSCNGCTLSATPTYSWDAAPGANRYILYVAIDPNFTTNLKTYDIRKPTGSGVNGTGQTSFVPLAELPDNNAGLSYYWWVRPCFDESCGPDPVGASTAVPAKTFQQASAPVELMAPANGSEVEYAPRFQWRDYLLTTAGNAPDAAPGTTDLEARTYEIQVSATPTFTSLIDQKVVDQTFFNQWDRTYPEGPLYWRVRAIDGSGNNLAWSATRLVMQKSPTPPQLLPSNGDTVQGVPTLKWGALRHSAAYEFEVYKNADPLYSPANKVLTVSTAFTEFTPVGALAPGEYSWRIRRKDADNRPGAWSDEAGDAAPRTFTIGNGSGPTLVQPTNASIVGDDVVFSWNAVPKAALYRFQRSTTSAFTTVTAKDTVMTAWAPPEKLAQGVWYWRVLALDSAGNVLTTSATRSVTKDVLPGAPTSVIGYPGDGSATVAWTAPAPTGGSAVIGYVVTPYLGGVAQPTTTTNSPTPTNVAINGLTNGAAYTFRVAARIAGGVGPQSALSGPVTPVAAAGVTKTVYVPTTPCRVVDTRSKVGPFGPGTQRNYQITGGATAFASQGGKPGGCGIPAGATAVQASVTAIAPSANGYFRAWPNGQAQPNATFLNFTKGQNITNTGAIALAPGGQLDLAVQNYGATTQYVIDVQGYFVAPAQVPGGVVGAVYVPVAPCRVVDTRSKGGAFKPNVERDYQVAGTGNGFAGQGGKANGCGIPDGAAAVEASVTAVGPSVNGFFRAWPADEAAPNATFLNFTKGQGITNTGAIKLAPAGTKDLTVQNYSATAHYVIDVQGYFVLPAAVPSGSVGSKFVAITPCRVVDTRTAGGLFGANQQRSYQVGGSGSGFALQGGKANGCAVPDGAAAVEASVTAASPTGTGFFRAWPAGQAAPNATFLNFTKGQNITNTGAISLAPTGTQDLTVQNYSPGSQYVIDVQGYYQP